MFKYISEISEEDEKSKSKDRVDIAFKKFDLDNDGYLSWHEFTQVF